MTKMDYLAGDSGVVGGYFHSQDHMHHDLFVALAARRVTIDQIFWCTGLHAR